MRMSYLLITDFPLGALRNLSRITESSREGGNDRGSVTATPFNYSIDRPARPIYLR